MLTVWRANLLGSSAKGNEYFLKHLLGTDSSVRADRDAAGPPAARRDLARRGARGQARPAADAGLPDDQHHDLLRRRAAGRHLVREARPEHHRHAPVRARVQPGDRPAVADPHRLRRLPRPSPRRSASWRATHLGVRRDLVAVPLHARHPGRDWPTRTASSGTGRPGECEPVPGRDDAEARRGRARLRRRRREDGRARPAGRHARRDHQGRHLRARAARSTTCGARTASCAAASADGRPVARRATSHVCEAILALSGTTNGHLAVPGLPARWRSAPARGWPTWPRSTRASGSPSPTPRPRPVPVITSPEWSGSETGGRRYSPFTINVERLKPWHTLTGRHALLPRPRLDDRARRGAADLPAAAGHARRCSASRALGDRRASSAGRRVRYLTPHSKWSIHSEYQDNLFMLSLSRGGPTIWMSDRDAAKIGVAGQRLDRGGQPQRRRGRPGDRRRTGCPRARSTCTTRRTG